MKVKEYAPIRAIVLGDFSIPEVKEYPKLTDEQILSMQPPSTQKLMQMAPHEDFIIEDNWRAKDVFIKEERDKKGDLVSIEADGRKIDAKIYLTDRRNRVHDFFYKKNLTSLIHPQNTDGTLELDTNPDWRKHLATDKLQHNTEIMQNKIEAMLQPPEEWREMTTWQAFKHWLKGGKVKSEVER